MSKKFRFIEDPGHGWLEVPMVVLEQLGIKDAISSCSYESVNGKLAYLEEDCDYATFIAAISMPAKPAGWKEAFQLLADPDNDAKAREWGQAHIEAEYHKDNDCFVRGLPHFGEAA